jgi:hypothetical protein
VGDSRRADSTAAIAQKYTTSRWISPIIAESGG